MGSTRVIKRGGLFAALASVSLLAACGSGQPTAGGSDTQGAADGAGDGGGGQIVLASWGGRFTESTQEAIIKPFTEETGIEVVVVEEPVGMVAQIEAQVDAGKVQWDLIEGASAADAFYLWKNDLAAPLSDDLRATLVEELGEDRLTDFGFTWSSYGFVTVCNKDTVEVCPKDSTGLFDPDTYPGRRMLVGMPASYSQAITFLGMAAGNPQDAPLPVDLEKAGEILRKVREHTRVWWTAGEQMEQAMRQGEVDMGIMFSGRAYKLLDEGMNLEIIWDKGVYSPGYTLRIANGPNPEGAEKFLEWVGTHPEAQAAWSELMGYGVPHPGALDLVDPAVGERLAEQPEHYSKLAFQNVEWYLENRTEIDTLMESIIAGG